MPDDPAGPSAEEGAATLAAMIDDVVTRGGDQMTGRVALVTGAERGIGAAAVRHIVAAGDHVVTVDACQGEEAEVGYRMATRTEPEELAAGCGDAVVAHVADVRDRAGLQAGVDLALER